MINTVRKKTKQFLREALETRDAGEEIRVIAIEKVGDLWVAEAEVIEKDLRLAELQVFEKKHYIVKLNEDLEILSYKQVESHEEEEE